MNILKFDPTSGGPKVWQYIGKNSPPSIKVEEWAHGYAVEYCIKASGGYIGRVDKPFWPWGNEKVILNHPQYYEDIVRLIEGYERESGKEVDFLYWQAD